MKLNIGDKVEKNLNVNCYWVISETMTGDANDYHTIEAHFGAENMDELKEYIIYCEVLKRQYPNGRGGGDSYSSLPFFEDYFLEDWFWDNYGSEDSFLNYTVTYFDENGVEYDVNVELTDEDKKEIEKYGILD